MATVRKFMPTLGESYCVMQTRLDGAEAHRRKRFEAVLFLQRVIRGYLVRKHIAMLSRNAKIIQKAFRVYRARKTYRLYLRRAVQAKHRLYYALNATKIQAVWRGHRSKLTKFNYYAYRRWLRTVTERGDRRAAEAAEYRIRSRADDLLILENEARQWLAYVVFKLHHLLRTHQIAGVFSDPNSSELSEFEKLLSSVKYFDYMRRLKSKYDEFVRRHKPKFSNKRLFPVIGDGADYWYLSLPEMYKLSSPAPVQKNTREQPMHFGRIHKKPFLWTKVTSSLFEESRGPFTPKPSKTYIPKDPTPRTPAPTRSTGNGDATLSVKKDPRFHLYLQHYKPHPDVFDYVDFHINVLMTRKCSIENIDKH